MPNRLWSVDVCICAHVCVCTRITRSAMLPRYFVDTKRCVLMKSSSLSPRLRCLYSTSNYRNRDRALTRFTVARTGSSWEKNFNCHRTSPSVICIRNYRCRVARGGKKKTKPAEARTRRGKGRKGRSERKRARARARWFSQRGRRDSFHTALA